MQMPAAITWNYCCKKTSPYPHNPETLPTLHSVVKQPCYHSNNFKKYNMQQYTGRSVKKSPLQTNHF